MAVSTISPDQALAIMNFTALAVQTAIPILIRQDVLEPEVRCEISTESTGSHCVSLIVGCVGSAHLSMSVANALSDAFRKAGYGQAARTYQSIQYNAVAVFYFQETN